MPENWSSFIALARPIFSVAGGVNPLLQSELISLTIQVGQNGPTFCEATFNNWISGWDVGYIFSDNNTFDLGKQLQVKVGKTVIFKGLIDSIRTVHPHVSSPFISVSSECKPNSQIQRTPRSRIPKSWELSIGESLREASINLVTGNMFGQAVAEFNVMLHCGDNIIINGILQRFVGNYSVTGVKHLFDSQQGLRTEFSVSRPA